MTAVLAALALAAGPAPAHDVCTGACHRRVIRKAHVREMRRYRAHPMPWCTWGPESGQGRGEWSVARYRQPNVSGGTGGGKFQLALPTFWAFGGHGEPHHARPVVQERIARRVLRGQGLGAWVNC
jgi:hypothetical protein